MNNDNESLIQKAARVDPHFIDKLSDEDVAVLEFDWRAWARPSQLAPEGDWVTWLRMAGRGEGKTRSASEWIRQRVVQREARAIALLGRTPADVRDVMIEGESGIMKVFPPEIKPYYEPSRRRITFHTGAIAHTYSSASPDELRGPQHDTAWTDELATFRTFDSWHNLQLGLRLGAPRQVVTTTPRPLRVLREIIKSPYSIVSRGATYDNRANLAPTFMTQILERYEGTHLGRQEIYGELLEEMPGALWRRDMIEHQPAPSRDDLTRVVVGVDPSISDGETSAECGIVVCALDKYDNFWVLDDATTRGSPLIWANKVIASYRTFNADRVIAEENQGGKMVEAVLRQIDNNVSYRGVHASQGKQARAEPIAALYEQSRIFHASFFNDLEDQMCVWVPGIGGDSPDRLDALVWGMTELIRPKSIFRIGAWVVKEGEAS